METALPPARRRCRKRNLEAGIAFPLRPRLASESTAVWSLRLARVAEQVRGRRRPRSSENGGTVQGPYFSLYLVRRPPSVISQHSRWAPFPGQQTLLGASVRS